MSSQVIDEAQRSATDSAAAKGQPCPGCRRVLPINDCRNAEIVADWECEACHAPLSGVLLQDATACQAEGVRLAKQYLDADRAEPIPASLRQLVEAFLIRRREKQDSHERRRNPRVACDLDAMVVALDDDWIPYGEPINAVVIDLAAHGLGMMTAVHVTAARLAIQIQCPTGLVQLIGRTAWSNLVGDSFQNTGVEFLVRLGRTALRTVEQ